MGYPRNHLINKYFLALCQNDQSPFFDPKAAFVNGLPENVNDYSSPILLSYYSLHDFPQFFHYHLESIRLGSNVTESKVSAG